MMNCTEKKEMNDDVSDVRSWLREIRIGTSLHFGVPTDLSLPWLRRSPYFSLYIYLTARIEV